MNTFSLPEFQRIWGWKIAIFLLFAGTGAGAYITGFVIGAIYHQFILIELAISVSAIFTAVSIIVMIWQVGLKANIVLAFSHLSTSWMSRGAIALAVFFVLTLIDIGLWLASGTYRMDGFHTTIGAINSIVSVFVLIYTGMLLKTLKSIAFWNSKLVPVLFLVLGLTTGIMGIAISLGIASFTTVVKAETISLLANFLAGLIIIETLFLVLYLWSRNRLDSKISVDAIIKGYLSVYFWVGMVIFGIVIPFIVVISIASPTSILIAGLVGLIGGLLIKYIIISGGASGMLDIRDELILSPVSARMTVSQYMSKLGIHK